MSVGHSDRSAGFNPAIRQIENLRYFQLRVSVEDIRGIRAIRGQILFEFDLPSNFPSSFGFRISDFSGAWCL